MGPQRRTDIVLGLTVLAVALFIAMVWVPLDSATGIIETVRRRVVIGDAMAPTIAAVFMGLGGAMVALFEKGDTAWRLTRRNVIYLGTVLAIVMAAFLVMRWLGPALGALLTDGGYRPLRDTTPWKHIGFLVGGSGLVAGLIAFVEGRITLRGALIGLAAALVLIAVYDLPFDDLLLPPNGDV